MKINWEQHIKSIENIEPRQLLRKALQHVSEKSSALDLGCGALNDTKFLSAQGFKHIDAVDGSKASQDLFNKSPIRNTQFHLSDFKDFKFNPSTYDLISAQFSLPFSGKNNFTDINSRILASLKPGGVFTGQLFGTRDDWNKEGSKLNFHTLDEAQNLFSEQEIILLAEEEYDNLTAAKIPKHWHVIEFIVRREQK